MNNDSKEPRLSHRSSIACIAFSALLVAREPNLVWLDVMTQVVNTFMLPVLIAVLVWLTQTTLAFEHTLRGAYLWVLAGLSLVICGAGLIGGLGILL